MRRFFFSKHLNLIKFFTQYGGDETRKMKLRENQKTGRAKLRQFGRVTVPHHVFFEIMRKGTSLN